MEVFKSMYIINFNVINSGQPDEMEEEEPYEEGEDSDVEKQDYSWKKAIMIGQSYQASVPSDLAAYGDTLPYGKYLLKIIRSKIFLL